MVGSMMRLALLSLCAGCAFAAVELDPVFGDHMVVQQKKPLYVFGTTDDDDTPVTVRFNGKRATAVVTKGHWLAELPPMAASARGHGLVVEQGSSKAGVEDVLIGELWLAAGQSNMLFRVDETENAAAIIPAAGNNLLRLHHGEPRPYLADKPFPQSELKLLQEGRMFSGSWAVCSPDSVKRMSAVAYLFANRLQQELKVPVGIVTAAVGGAEMICWTPPSVLKAEYMEVMDNSWPRSPFLTPWHRTCAEANLGENVTNAHPFKPGYLYRTGIDPWLHMSLAGVIWYQGEADAELQDAKQSKKLLTHLIEGWRKEGTAPEDPLPFIMVQLPRIKDTKDGLRAGWPEFRRLQHQVAEKLPKVGCVCTIDLGSKDTNVHPRNKDAVAARLAAHALSMVYGRRVPCRGPELRKAKADGETVELVFNYADGLQTTDGKAPAGFELADKSRQFEPARAVINGKTIRLKADFVDEPVYVRYLWAPHAEPNLINRDKLPAMPFSRQL